MTDTIEKGLHLALESPDRVIRDMALRREELQRTLAQLDVFLRSYAELSSGAITPASGRPQQASQPKTRRKMAARKSTVDFSTEIVGFLQTKGAPMSFAEIRSAYAERHGAEPEQNVYRRLRRLDNIVNVKGSGYWLANTPLPNEQEVSSGAD